MTIDFEVELSGVFEGIKQVMNDLSSSSRLIIFLMYCFCFLILKILDQCFRLLHRMWLKMDLLQAINFLVFQMLFAHRKSE